MSLAPKNKTTWRPSASWDALHARAKLYRNIRDFFSARGVLEVETPLLARYGVTDIHTETLGAGDGFLQTSPEYAMKRLLAAYRQSIFQICKAFRQEECGSKHHPEFTLLEWYRIDYDHHQLMDETDVLLQRLINCKAAERHSYQAIFQQYLGIDPLTCSLTDCLTRLQDNIDITDKDTALSLLMNRHIEPQLGRECPVFIYDYPSSQAALARISPHDKRVAQRFEVYIHGIELANGFYELNDATEQQQRFAQDQLYRQQQQLPYMEMDTDLLAALEHGLPNCAGIALGIDRLLMVMCGKDNIGDVMSFTNNV